MKIKKFRIVFIILSIFSNKLFAEYSESPVFGPTGYVMYETFEVIKSQDRNTLLDFYPDLYREDEIADAYADWEGPIPEEAYIHWYNEDLYQYITVCKLKEEESEEIEKIKKYWSRKFVEVNTGDFTIYSAPFLFICNSCVYKENRYFFSIKQILTDSGKGIIFNENIKNDLQKCKNIEITTDGDYFEVKFDDFLVHKFCRIDQESLKQYGNILENNSCDLSKVTWPRHADGTSEYDDKIIVSEPIKLFENEAKTEEITNTHVPGQQTTGIREKTVEQILEIRTVTVKKNNEMILAEDSVVRLDPSSEGTFMTSVAKGAKVKIKKVGRKETINGVTSNWVLINFAGDAYNTKGKKIYYKTEGWLFGGYLE